MLRRRSPPPPTITDLLNDAVARAQRTRPGLTMSEIAYHSRISQPTLSRAKNHACSATTLERVLGGIALITDGEVDLRLGLVENA